MARQLQEEHTWLAGASLSGFTISMFVLGIFCIIGLLLCCRRRRPQVLPAAARVRTAMDHENSSEGPSKYVDLEPLRALLLSGDVALVKASYLLDLANAGGILPRRQDLPEHALLDSTMLAAICDEIKAWLNFCAKLTARRLTYTNAMRFPQLVAISYAWAEPEHPDASVGYAPHDRMATLSRHTCLLSTHRASCCKKFSRQQLNGTCPSALASSAAQTSTLTKRAPHR